MLLLRDGFGTNIWNTITYRNIDQLLNNLFKVIKI